MSDGDPFAELADITETVEFDFSGGEGPRLEEAGPHNAALGDQEHPAMSLLDMAFDEGGNFCHKQNLPAPKSAIWEDFGKPLLNRAAWHYIPEAKEPNNPLICLVGGLVLGLAAFTPAIIEVLRRRTTEEAQQPPQTPQTPPTPIMTPRQAVAQQVQPEPPTIPEGTDLETKLKNNFGPLP